MLCQVQGWGSKRTGFKGSRNQGTRFEGREILSWNLPTFGGVACLFILVLNFLHVTMIINPNLSRILWNIPFLLWKVPAFSTTFLQTLLILFRNFSASSIRLLATYYQLCHYITWTNPLRHLRTVPNVQRLNKTTSYLPRRIHTLVPDRYDRQQILHYHSL